jgi:endonuclease/exonuclease/phosphatase family metal-dependent hydrolase
MTGRPFTFNGRVRTESAKLLRDRMVQITGLRPYVVTGDFNASPASVAYRTLLAEPSLTKSSPQTVFRVAHPVARRNEGTFHLFFLSPLLLIINYLHSTNGGLHNTPHNTRD